jgi:hypothetical protein
MSDETRTLGKPQGSSGWTGRSFRYSVGIEKRELIEHPEGGYTFTAEAAKEIRRAFPRRFAEAEIDAFLRRMAGALSKMASDLDARNTDPRAARDRAEKVAKLLAEAVSEIGKMTETERDVFDLATSADPVTLGDLSAALETAATGFQRAADGLALGRGEKVAGPNAGALYVAAQAADAWQKSFNKQPSAGPDSPFTAVLTAILQATELELLGKDAIRTAIKGPPKIRK